MPFLGQFGTQALQCDRPRAGELPLADLDFGPLIGSFGPAELRRLILLLLAGPEPSLAVVGGGGDDEAAEAAELHAIVEALVALLYPLGWPHRCIPVLPQVCLSEISKPGPFVYGVLRRHVFDEVNFICKMDFLL